MTVPPVESRLRFGRWPLLAGAIALSLVPAVVLVLLAGDRSPSARRDGRTGPNTIPVATADAFSVPAGEVALLDVVANDADADGDPLVVIDVPPESSNGATVLVDRNLVLNGEAERGDNTNFSAFDYAPGAGPDGSGAFVTSQAVTLTADEFVPVDPTRSYVFEAWSKADPNVEARHFVGFLPYDADRLPINPWYVAYGEGTETTLAADLALGDTEIQLVDATGWSNAVGAPGRSRNIIMYPYTNSLGETYEPYTYSRHTALAPASGLWAPGAVDENTIRLDAPWNRLNPDDPEGVWPAGTEVANAHGGPSFTYALVSGEPYTSEWERHSAVVAGTATGGRIPSNLFRPGTAFVRFAVIANVDLPGSVAHYGGIRIVDGSVVEYRPAPGFSGTDTFAYTVGDGFGGTATASVTVGVVPNTDPVAADDAVTVRQGQAAAINLTANDSDADGDTISIVAVDYDSSAGATVELARNLVSNGDLALGDGTNFPGFVFDPEAGPDGGPALTTSRSGTFLTEEAVPVDLTHVYEFRASSRASSDVGARHFVGFASYDADGLPIEPWHVAYAPGSETTLAEDLEPGDTRIVLDDATGWSNQPTEREQTRNIVLYPYTDGQGQTYEPYTYSRNTERAPPEGLWEPGAIDDDVIELRAPWRRRNPDDRNGTWPAGTPVANAQGGPTFNYALVANERYTPDWTAHAGVASGLAPPGEIVPTQFRPGTESIRFVVVANHGAAGSVAHYADISIRDLDTSLTYEPAPGFTGMDSFSYTIEDSGGGTATATVTVTVEPNLDPVAVDDAATLLAGEALVLDPLVNDRDPEGDELRVADVSYDSGNGATVELDANLVANGDGASGGNDNFSAFDFEAGAGPGGVGGAFVTEEVVTMTADELIPVDPTHHYAFEAWSKADPNVGARHFVGFISYDADRLPIHPWHVAYASDSETTLAADLAPGDTEIRLVDATGWTNDDRRPGPWRNIVMYPYTNEQGDTFEPYTYSRLTELAPLEGLWTPEAIEGNTITLAAPWARPNPDDPGGVWPAGTEVANAVSGPTFNYALVSNEPYTSEWVRHATLLRTTSDGGSIRADQFRPATAFVRFAVIANRGPGGSVAHYAGIRLTDLTAPVTYRPAPGFTGTDTFTYTVGDGRGGTDTGTVTIEVAE